MLNKATFLQLVRYGVVGLTSNALGYLVYLLITYLGVEHKIAMTLLYITGVTIGFFGNRKWVFRHDGHLSSAAWRFGIAHLAGYLLNLSLLLVFVDRLSYPHQYVQGAAIFVVAAFLFIMFRLFVFPSSSARGAP